MSVISRPTLDENSGFKTCYQGFDGYQFHSGGTKIIEHTELKIICPIIASRRITPAYRRLAPSRLFIYLPINKRCSAEQVYREFPILINFAVSEW